ncbi:MAG: DUF1311 domain-containing protein [Gammaproteobacteria bacterium]|nr:DUF1311 domain-containing protein [Gammaproteobacteria bacterium]MDH5650629.1 DUF1311 domain-containing protein [Gammaproteobacteria bacterium]
MKSLSVFLLYVFATVGVAQAAGSGAGTGAPDCAVIQSSPQLDACVHKHWVAAEAELAAGFGAYRQRIKTLYAADAELGKKLLDKVQQAHSAWLTFRDANCRVEAFEIEEGTPAYVTTLENCLIRMNAERFDVLKKLP